MHTLPVKPRTLLFIRSLRFLTTRWNSYVNFKHQNWNFTLVKIKDTKEVVTKDEIHLMSYTPVDPSRSHPERYSCADSSNLKYNSRDLSMTSKLISSKSTIFLVRSSHTTHTHILSFRIISILSSNYVILGNSLWTYLNNIESTVKSLYLSR